jgi:hypothetical protein
VEYETIVMKCYNAFTEDGCLYLNNKMHDIKCSMSWGCLQLSFAAKIVVNIVTLGGGGGARRSKMFGCVRERVRDCVHQGFSTSGQWAACGPSMCFVRPALTFGKLC